VANPVLSDKTFTSVRQESAGWAAPDPRAAYAPPPMVDATNRMTMSGTMTATAVLLALLLTAGIVGWRSVHLGGSFPSWTLLAIFGAIGVAFLTSFKPHLARITGPIYAVIEGLVVGAISHAYNLSYHGIVVQAAGATIAVAAVVVFLQRTGIVKVTDRMRRTVMAATLGVMLLYGVSHADHQRRHAGRHPVQRARRRPGCFPSADRRRLHRQAGEDGRTEGHGVVRRIRPHRHPGVAVPRDPAPAGQAPAPLTATDPNRTARGGAGSRRRRLGASGLAWPTVATAE
jgi:Bax inhibitor 1 like